MSIQPPVVDSGKEYATHSRSRSSVNVQRLPTGAMVSPEEPVPPFQIQSQNLSHEPNVRIIQGFGPKELHPSSQVVAPVSQPGPHSVLQSSSVKGHHTHHYDMRLAYDGSLSIENQSQSSSNLENQLHDMILSHGPPPAHQQTPFTNTSTPSALPQSPNSRPHGNRRRPNQAQRKQQAQQMQIPLQSSPVTPASTNLTEMRPSYYYGLTPMNGNFVAQQPIASILPPSHTNQNFPPRVVSQPRTLFDPNLEANNRRVGGSRLPSQAVDLQKQIDYVDHLARLKIPEVQMSAEECGEKQILKGRLNDICRQVVSDHELKSNADFPPESVELKSFGSLSIGFATKDSDMDLVLVSPASKPDLSAPESEIPRKIEEALMNHGYGARLLSKTRVPIVKFCEKPSPELAAHLRLTRLWWEQEQDLGVYQADLKSSARAPEIRADSSENLQISNKRQDRDLDATNDSNPHLLRSHGSEKLQSSEASKSALPSTDARKEKKSGRETLKFDRAWLFRLSDYELIGLFQTILKEGRCAHQQRSIIADCLEYLHKQADFGDPVVLQKKREILRSMTKVIDKIGPPSREYLEFPKSGVGTQCDINFSNQIALHNSLLLKCYSLCDPRVRQIVLFVKAWTKIRKINSPYHGTLNSYGYVLMVLHFLMNVARPPVIPNLQLATDMIRKDPLSSQEASFDGHNVQFFRNEAAIKAMAEDGALSHNRESLGSLLRGFFQFYANPPYGSFSWKDNVLSLRTRGGILTKVGKGWTGAKIETVDMAGPGSDHKKVSHRYIVAIEDPFETGHNVARTVFFNGVVVIRNEFRRAADLIASGGIDPRLGPQDFFAEGKKYEHLQKRNDNPRESAAPNKSDPTSHTSATAKEPTLSNDAVV